MSVLLRAAFCLTAFSGVCVELVAQQAAYPRAICRPPFSYRHASTAREGELMGISHCISAIGEQMVNRAIANDVNERAKRLAIVNEQERIQAWWALREENRRQRFGHRVKMPVPLPREKSTLTPRLSPHELDPMTYVIRWPELLSRRVFSDERVTLDRLLAERRGDCLSSGSIGYIATQTHDAMMKKLRNRIRDVKPMEYVAAKRFIAAVRNEILAH